jgi:esterase/lipase superfamily enzyme
MRAIAVSASRTFPRSISCAALVLAALTLSGCATYRMMPTPLLYTGQDAKPLFTDLPENRRTPPLDLLYVTDRVPASGPHDVGPYTAGRSRHLAFGSTTVEFGDGVAWNTLVAHSMVAERKVSIELTLGPTTELGRFPRIPYEIVRSPAGLSRTPAVVAAHEAAHMKLQAEVARRLALSPRKEFVLYVHGYANTFEESAVTMGELCHFLGREFVCAVFTWPAGGSGFFFGYDVDRESGEFAEMDLKKTIRMIADTPGLQKLHVLAHSRGTDLIATALSDLSVEAYIARTTLARRFKIGNIVLIAPDLDFDVAPTKIWKTLSDPDLPYGRVPDPGVLIPPGPGIHITVYVSPSDKALAIAGWRFGSLVRLGRIDANKMDPEDIAHARAFEAFDVIEVPATSCVICHSYFTSDPRVSSDLIALLRYGLKPNERGRPLIDVEKPFWRVPVEAETSAPR